MSRSYTSQLIVNILKEMREKTDIKSVAFTDIPAKAPDAKPMDFCDLELLKSAFSKRRLIILRRHCKTIQDERNKTPHPILTKGPYCHGNYDLER